MEVCYDQPRRTPPPRLAPRHQRSESGSSALTAKWKSRSRSLASRASSQGSVLLRRSTGARSRRPTIGAPSDFRRMPNDQSRRTEGFRPLELSIYLPRNRLSPLPDFGSPDEPADQASPAWTSPLPRTTSMGSQALSDFRIARKPLHYRSFDALSTASAWNSDWVMQPLQPRPSLSTTQSSHELGYSARKQLPRPPPSARTYSHMEPIRHQSRRDSDGYRHMPARWSRADTLDRSDIETIPALDELPSTRSSFDMMAEFNDDFGRMFASTSCSISKIAANKFPSWYRQFASASSVRPCPTAPVAGSQKPASASYRASTGTGPSTGITRPIICSRSAQSGVEKNHAISCPRLDMAHSHLVSSRASNHRRGRHIIRGRCRAILQQPQTTTNEIIYTVYALLSVHLGTLIQPTHRHTSIHSRPSHADSPKDIRMRRDGHPQHLHLHPQTSRGDPH